VRTKVKRRETERDRDRERQRQTETERDRDRETERERDRETETERERERETERQRDRERGGGNKGNVVPLEVLVLISCTERLSDVSQDLDCPKLDSDLVLVSRMRIRSDFKSQYSDQKVRLDCFHSQPRQDSTLE
jgi:hypothetical protein